MSKASRRSLPLLLLLLPILLFITQPMGLSAQEVPPPPTRLQAEVAGNTVSLSWLPPDSAVAVQGYIVEVAHVPSGPIVATVAVADSRLDVPNVPPGVYYVRVRSVGPVSQSAPSSEASVSVDGVGSARCDSIPPPPRELAAVVDGSFVSLRWSAATGDCPVSYEVHVGATPGAADIALMNTGTQTQLSASAPAGTYFARVIARNQVAASAASNEVQITVNGAGGLYRGRIAASFVNDPIIELVAADVSGVIVALSRAAAGSGPIATFHFPDRTQFAIALRADGRPDSLVSDDGILVFENYTDNRVDVAIIPFRGDTSIVRDVALAAAPFTVAPILGTDDDGDPTFLTFKLRHLRLAVETSTCIVGRIPAQLLKLTVAAAACSLTFQEAWRTLGLGPDPLADERALQESRDASGAVLELTGAVDASQDCATAVATRRVDESIKCMAFVGSTTATIAQQLLAAEAVRVTDAKTRLAAGPGLLTGRWTGTYRYGPNCANYVGVESMDLVEDAVGHITGTFLDVVLSPSTGTTGGDVRGTRTGSQVRLDLNYTFGSAAGIASRFDGTFDGTSLTGKTGVCGTGADITLTR